MPSDIVPRHSGGDIIESVITKGDLSKLTPQERVQYYQATCASVGLNPLTRPLEYINLNGKLVLYARRDAADQLRKINGISVEVVSQKVDGDMLTVHVRAQDKTGRRDEDFGVVSIAGLRGEARANATLKCITKAKRRVTLSIAGLGFLDETEVDDIPQPAQVPVNTNADLDEFAAEAVPYRGIVLDEAHAAAERGTAAFREFWKDLDAAERDSIREHLAAFHAAATAADDPFGLPPEQSPPDEPVEHPGATPPAGNSTRQGEPSQEPAPPVEAGMRGSAALLDEGENLVVPLPVRPNADQLDFFGRQLLHLIGERPLTAQRAAWIGDKNERGIAFLKLKNVEQYDAVQRALHAVAPPS